MNYNINPADQYSHQMSPPPPQPQGEEDLKLRSKFSSIFDTVHVKRWFIIDNILVLDPSTYAAPAAPQVPSFPGQQFLGDPVVTNMAMQYGQSLANTGKTYIDQNVKLFFRTVLSYIHTLTTSSFADRQGCIS